MLAKCVYDINTVMSIIPKGSYWAKKANYNEWTLSSYEETLAIDIKEGNTDTLMTIELVREQRLTYDLPELH